MFALLIRIMRLHFRDAIWNPTTHPHPENNNTRKRKNFDGVGTDVASVELTTYMS